MEILFHGHSCVQINANGKSLVIDPFLRGNPQAVIKPEDIRVNAVLLTHAHTDHILDAESIARANEAPIVAIHELATYFGWKGLQAAGMNLGGTIDLGFAQVKMIQAFHSSGIILDDEKRIIYGGMPAGYIISAEGLTILHAGDTCLYGDMKMIGDRHSIDVAFIPIGDRFTMGPDDALQAAEWFGAKAVVPVHYGTFPPIQQDSALFVKRLEDKGISGRVMVPGDRFSL
jgi:L-ascorbate metabolism protein UlaG (beta-lactamase superfamily)